MEERIKKIIFKEKEENLDCNWMDLNLNSIEYVKLIVELETELDCEFDDEILIYNKNECIKEFIDKIVKSIS